MISSKTRETIFGFFGAIKLPQINTNAKPIDIANWKKNPEVANCFENLFKKIDENEDSPLLLTYIIERVLDNNYTNIEMAYVVVISISLLSPNCQKLKLSSNEMKNKIKIYLVSYYKINNKLLVAFLVAILI